MDCHYCGAPANTKDHIIPVSYLRNMSTNKARRAIGQTVDCCAECNSLLGAKALFTIEERAEEIARMLSRRYKKELDAPVWTDEEIEDLGPSLRESIKGKQFLRNEVMERVRNALSVSCGALDKALPLYTLS